MPATPRVHEKAFRVRWAETGPDGLLRPPALIDWMQEAAGEHATLLGVGMEAFAARGLGWVLARLSFEAARWPGPGEHALLRTWPSARDGLLFHRDFEILDEAGAPLARATTARLVFDLARRRPARSGDLLPDFPYDGGRALVVAVHPPAVPPPEAAEERFVARRSDLDVNGHVNNAAFLRWALDAAPAGLAEDSRPAALDVALRGEAFAGDRVVVLTGQEPGARPGTLLQRILREDDGRELARLRVRWRRAPAG